MFVACGIWCLADVSSVSPSSEQSYSPTQKKSLFLKTSLPVKRYSMTTLTGGPKGAIGNPGKPGGPGGPC